MLTLRYLRKDRLSVKSLTFLFNISVWTWKSTEKQARKLWKWHISLLRRSGKSKSKFTSYCLQGPKCTLLERWGTLSLNLRVYLLLPGRSCHSFPLVEDWPVFICLVGQVAFCHQITYFIRHLVMSNLHMSIFIFSIQRCLDFYCKKDSLTSKWILYP